MPAEQDDSLDMEESTQRPISRHDLIPEEQDRPPTEGELRAFAASNRIQAVFRGHRERRAALFTPLWVPYPSPLRALQWGYEARSSVAELQREFDYREQVIQLIALSVCLFGIANLVGVGSFPLQS
jgi:hypothetical protein